MATILWILFVIGIGLLLPTAYAGLIGAPYAPTRRPVIAKAFDQLKIGPDELVIDLGAGDGKVLLAASARGAQSIGYELSPIMWAVAWLRTRRAPKTSVRLSNFFRATLPAGTTTIFVFLMPESMPRLREYLLKQSLPESTRILAYTFPFKDIQPRRLFHEPRAGTIYLYTLADLHPDTAEPA